MPIPAHVPPYIMFRSIYRATSAAAKTAPMVPTNEPEKAAAALSETVGGLLEVELGPEFDKVGVTTTVPLPDPDPDPELDPEPDPEPEPDAEPPLGVAVGLTMVGPAWEGPSAPPEETTAPPVAAVETEEMMLEATETEVSDSGDDAEVVPLPIIEDATEVGAVVAEFGAALAAELVGAAMEEDGATVALELAATALQLRSYNGVVLKVVPLTRPKDGFGVVGSASCIVNHHVLTFPNNGQPTAFQYFSAFSVDGIALFSFFPETGQPVSVIQTGFPPTAALVAASASSKRVFPCSMLFSMEFWKYG